MSLNVIAVKGIAFSGPTAGEAIPAQAPSTPVPFTSLSNTYQAGHNAVIDMSPLLGAFAYSGLPAGATAVLYATT